MTAKELILSIWNRQKKGVGAKFTQKQSAYVASLVKRDHKINLLNKNNTFNFEHENGILVTGYHGVYWREWMHNVLS